MATDHSTEQWRDIAGFPGYQVSDLGRVRSRKIRGQADRLAANWHIIKLHECHRGHLQTRLWRNSKATYRYVHRLVLEAFLGPCPPGKECCHGDGNPKNNVPNNLRWDTPAANVQDMIAHGTKYRVCLQGERNGSAKLTEAEVREMLTLYAFGWRLCDLAKRFSCVSTLTIYKIVNRLKWAWVVV